MFGREPALWIGFIQAALACAVGFGLSISTEQMAMILSVTSAGLALLTRQTSTANATVRDAGLQPAAIASQAAANRATGTGTGSGR